MLVGGSYSIATDSPRVYIQLSNADQGDRCGSLLESGICRLAVAITGDFIVLLGACETL